ncbi:proteasome interacting protein [Schizosaccharomyces japonicus yFS275]|uniref:Proteasome interacting protein n=1 Tax=Schizosaccharomyces japonicus (strain yFS275 / FY16936) TaxID=402676 RepID=B6K5L4_SCHJY|nr:proteasome interacting protein [Schizosaccharomyces japonicus yFS275]EEB08818.1 proteasome interacting protein [Schizosaccharomyces japonicus yFS275]
MSRHQCTHDCSEHAFESSPSDSLYNCIDLDKVFVLNEGEESAGSKVIKPWDKRYDDTDILKSDVDDQLIIHIPFTGSVCLKSILVRVFSDGSAPQSVSLFPNRTDLDFESVDERKPTETFQLPVEGAGSDVLEFPVKTRLYQNMANLNLFFRRDDGDDEPVEIAFIGLRGTFIPFKGNPIITLYEAAPRPTSHKLHGVNLENRFNALS